jgi:hypothetical protein
MANPTGRGCFPDPYVITNIAGPATETAEFTIQSVKATNFYVSCNALSALPNANGQIFIDGILKQTIPAVTQTSYISFPVPANATLLLRINFNSVSLAANAITFRFYCQTPFAAGFYCVCPCPASGNTQSITCMSLTADPSPNYKIISGPYPLITGCTSNCQMGTSCNC